MVNAGAIHCIPAAKMADFAFFTYKNAIPKVR
jgi:hypothetical protein